MDFDPVIDNALAAGNPIPDVFAERAERRQNTKQKKKGDVCSKDTSNNIQTQFPSEFEYTEKMGWIPKGWGVETVENLLEINPRITLKKGTVAQFSDIKSLPTSGYNIGNVINKEYAGGAKFQNDDILFA